jgi:hypothetical protein
MRLLFEWDPAKARANLSKHRVSFNEAGTVFADPLSLTFRDPDHSTDEERYIIIGESLAGRTLVVAYTDGGDRIRIVAARQATRSERKAYEETK